jgi:hypothetical protein
MLCQYKDILGVPRQGVHSYRLFNVAIVDVAMTVVAAYLISRLFRGIPFLTALTALFVLGVVLHRVLCVDTTVDRLLR